MLEKLEQAWSANRETTEEQEELFTAALPVSSVSDTSRNRSPTPLSDDPDDELTWDESPTQQRQSGEILPPDSSAPGPEDTMLPPDSPRPTSKSGSNAFEKKSASLPSRESGTSSNNTAKQDSSLGRTSDMYPSAVYPGQSQPTRTPPLRTTLPQPSTLSQSDFDDLLHESSRPLAVSHRDRLIQSSYTPGFPFGQLLPQEIHGDDEQDLPTSDIHASLAEQQLQQELRASATKTLVNRSPSVQAAPPSSPLQRPLSERAENERQIEPTTPRSGVGIKRPAASPLSSRARSRKSRFEFSQDEPQSQKPEHILPSLRREFLKEQSMKPNAARRQHVEHRAGVPESPHRRVPSHLPARSRSPSKDVPFSPHVQGGGARMHSSPRIMSSPHRQASRNLVSPRALQSSLRIGNLTTPSLIEVPDSPLGVPDGDVVMGDRTPQQTPTGKRLEPARSMQINTPRSQHHGVPMPAKPDLSLPKKPPVVDDRVTPMSQDSIYREFVAAYPVYDGDITVFVNIARMVYNTRAGNDMFPVSIWDDFIIRYRTDYTPHINGCLTRGDSVEPYQTYYQNKFEDVSYKKGIIRPPQLEVMFKTNTRSDRAIRGVKPLTNLI